MRKSNLFNRTAIIGIVFLSTCDGFLIAQEKSPSISQEIKITKRVKVSDAERAKIKNAKNTVVNDPAVDTFTITSVVQDAKPKRFGSAPRFGSYKAWSTHRFNKISSSGGNFEPYIFRALNRVVPQGKKATDKRYESTEEYIGGCNISFFGMFTPSYIEGGELHLYRKKGLYYELIHTTKVKKFELDPAGKMSGGDTNRLYSGKIWFSEKGPVAQEGDHYTITKEFVNLPPMFRKKPNVATRRHNQAYSGMKLEGQSTYVLDASTYAPESGSTTSMKMASAGGRDNSLLHSYLREKQYWLSYRPGKKYMCELWMKASESQKVTVEFGAYGQGSVTVGTEWKKYEIPVPEFKLQSKGNQLRLYTDSQCTLWLDNYIIYEVGTPKFGIFQRYVDIHKEWKAEDIRFMSYLNFGRNTLDSLLDEGFAMKEIVNGKGGTGSFTGLGLGSLLKFAKDVGANPWINIRYYTKEECLGLMEYLSGDASTKYGGIRAKYGQVEPWTRVFSEINIEVGNECWNGNYAPMAFTGTEYAAVCNRIFKDIKSSPYYDAKKHTLVSGGRMGGTGWNKVMIDESIEATMLCTANYIGGWDGLTLVGESDEEFFQGQLLYSPHVTERSMRAMQEAATAAGRGPDSDHPMLCGSYEFGPGYAIPNAGKPYIPESEQVGKSLALGITTLDFAMNWLDIGYKGAMSFFNSGHGSNWTSHSMPPNEYPHAMWQTLGLRNKYCDGALMKVEETDVKTINIPDTIVLKMHKAPNFFERLLKGRENVPMSKCYAFKKGKTHAFLLLNRSNDEARETKLVLPYAPEKTITIYEVYSEKPSANNIKEYQVKTTKTVKNDFTREYTFTLPPTRHG